MKKFLAILICLSLLVGGAFAQITPTVAGDATLSWGIDFGGSEITHGFYNELGLIIRIPLLSGTSFTGGSESQDADVYVEFSTARPILRSPVSYRNNDGKLNMDANTSPSRTKAILHFYGAYITVWNTPSFSADYACTIMPVFTDGLWDGSTYCDVSGGFAPSFKGWGTKIGYANEDILGLDVALKVASNKTWFDNGYGEAAGDDKEDGTAHSAYALGLDFGMKPVEDYLTVKATVNAILSDNAGTYKADYAGNPFVNFGVKLGSAPVEGLDIAVGFDGAYYNGKFGYEVGLDTTYEWVNLGVLYGSHNGLNVGLNFDANPDDKALPGPVENLGLHVGLNFYDLVNFGTAKAVDFGVGLSYLLNLSDSMTLTPSAKFALMNQGDTMAMAYEIGVDYSPMEKVIVGLNWHQGGIENNVFQGPVLNDLRNHKGTLVLSLTLEY